MFRKAIVLNIIILVASLLNPTFSQTDTTHISYSQENADSSDYNYKRKYMYLDINMQEENNMFSIGVAPNAMYNNGSGYEGSRFELSLQSKYDRKFSPSFSIYSEIVSLYSNSEGSSVDKYGGQRMKASLNFGMRYYYNQKKNIKMGITASNFNGSYLDFKINNVLYYNYYDLKQDVFNTISDILNPQSKKGSEFDSNFPNAFTLALGYQQKLTKQLFMDGNVFIVYHYGYSEYFDNNLNSKNSEILFGFSFKFGFGWGWK